MGALIIQGVGGNLGVGAMSMLLCVAALGLNVPSPLTRRHVLVGAGAVTASNGASPVHAYLSTTFNGKGPSLIMEGYTKELPAGNLLAWYESALSPTFVADIDGLILDRAAFLKAQKSILESFPDMQYTPKGISFADSPKRVGWTAYYIGSHSGAPFSPLEGVPALSPKSPPVTCADKNFGEIVVADFASGLEKIDKLTIKQLAPGAGKYSAGAGLYLQAGGDASKLPPLPPPPPPEKLFGLF